MRKTRAEALQLLSEHFAVIGDLLEEYELTEGCRDDVMFLSTAAREQLGRIVKDMRLVRPWEEKSSFKDGQEENCLWVRQALFGSTLCSVSYGGRRGNLSTTYQVWFSGAGRNGPSWDQAKQKGWTCPQRFDYLDDALTFAEEQLRRAGWGLIDPRTRIEPRPHVLP